MRRGAWYRVIEVTRDEVVVEVNHRARPVPLSAVDLAAGPPQRWSVVPRPRDAIRLPDDWGGRYAICPACRNRTPIRGHPVQMRCPRCAGVFAVAWNESAAGTESEPSGSRSPTG